MDEYISLLVAVYRFFTKRFFVVDRRTTADVASGYGTSGSRFTSVELASDGTTPVRSAPIVYAERPS